MIWERGRGGGGREWEGESEWGRGRERDREGNINLLYLLFHLFLHSLVAFLMFPDQGSNPQPWCIRDNTLTKKWATQVLGTFSKHKMGNQPTHASPHIFTHHGLVSKLVHSPPRLLHQRWWGIPYQLPAISPPNHNHIL